jgi:ABC-type Fe3+ transport system substrate-binding protein
LKEGKEGIMVNIQKWTGLFAVILILLTVGCRVEQVGLSPSPPPAKALPKLVWEEEWKKTVAAAKSEGKLVIYTTSGTEVRAALSKSFQEKFGIDIEYVAGRGPELTEKLFSERRAGLYLADVYMAGATTPVTQLKPVGILSPIKPLLLLPEVVDNKAYFDDQIPYVDKEGMYIITIGPYVAMTLAVNSDVVKPGEIRGYTDLLDPKWKDKIAFADPTIAGAASRFFLMTALAIMNPDFHRQLVKQEPLVTRDRRLQVDWVARGKYPIALAPTVEVVADFQKAGAAIKWISPQEGVYLSSGAGNISYFSQAPHPNAAKVFVNWLMTREGLTIWSKSSLIQTARKDVPTDFLHPEGVRDPKVKYFDSNREEVLVREEEFYKLAMEIYGPLMK